MRIKSIEPELNGLKGTGLTWNNRGDYWRPNTIKINLNYAHREWTLFSFGFYASAETRWCHASCWWRNIKRQLVWSSLWPKLDARDHFICIPLQSSGAFSLALPLICWFFFSLASHVHTQHFLIENVEHKAHAGDRTKHTDTLWIAALHFQVTGHGIYMLYFAFVLFYFFPLFSTHQFVAACLVYPSPSSIIITDTVLFFRTCVCACAHVNGETNAAGIHQTKTKQWKHTVNKFSPFSPKKATTRNHLITYNYRRR